MQPQKLEDRPPFVQFETRSEEDREATIEKGHYVGMDVDYAFITPAGSKDRIERKVSEWFAKLEEDLASERIPAPWVRAFKEAYKAFQEGKAPPVSGFPIVDWPGLSPSQVKTLLSLNLRAVEDLAVANEETLARLGMGARALKQRAIDWLAAAENTGKVAEESAARRAENADLRARNAALEEQMAQLSAQVKALSAAQQPFNQPAAMAPASSGISADDLGLGEKL